MRLQFLVQNYPPERGPVRYTANIAKGLAARGHRVHVITALPHYPTGLAHPEFGRFRPVRRVEAGVEIARVPVLMASNTQLVRRVIGFLSFLLSALVAGIRTARPHVVVASVPPVPVALSGLLIARLRRIPLVILLRDVEPLVTLRIRRRERSRIARGAVWLAMRLYAAADAIVVVHESQTADLISYGVASEKIHVIPHGLDLGEFDQQAATPHADGAMARPGRCQALYVGTLGAAQGVEDLITAFSAPALASLPVDLVTIGGGECAPRCRELADATRGRVRVLDPVPLDEVPRWLCASDLLVVSYRRSTAPIPGMIGSKFYEYCAAGRPILVYGEGMAADRVRESSLGHVVAVGDQAGLRAALTALLADRTAAREQGQRARRLAERELSLSDRAEQWAVVLERVCASRPDGGATA